MSDGFLYYRVSTAALLQFAQLAINSNEHHPAHHRHLTSPSAPPPSSINRWDVHHLVHSSLSDLLPPTTSLPLPLVSLILDYCTDQSFIAGEANGVLHLYSSTLDPLTTLSTPHTDYTSSCTHLPDTDTLVTGSWDGDIRLYHSTHTQLFHMTGTIHHKAEVHALSWGLIVNPLSDEAAPSHIVALLVGSSLSTLDIYHPTTFRLLHSLSGHTAKISAIVTLPPTASSASSPVPLASRVVTSSWDGDCRLWDLNNLQCEAVLTGQHSPLTSLTVTDQGLVVAGDVKGQVRQWRITGVKRVVGEVKREVRESSTSSIASIRFASSSSFPHLFNFPPTSPSHPPDVLLSLPSSPLLTLSSPSPIRALLPLSSTHLLVGSDSGLHLYTLNPSSPSPTLLSNVDDGGKDQRVYALLELSGGRVVAGMAGKRVVVWRVEEDEAGVRMVKERVLEGMTKSVRCLTLRETLDIQR